MSSGNHGHLLAFSSAERLGSDFCNHCSKLWCKLLVPGFWEPHGDRVVMRRRVKSAVHNSSQVYKRSATAKTAFRYVIVGALFHSSALSTPQAPHERIAPPVPGTVSQRLDREPTAIRRPNPLTGMGRRERTGERDEPRSLALFVPSAPLLVPLIRGLPDGHRLDFSPRGAELPVRDVRAVVIPLSREGGLSPDSVRACS
ncbi:hypothetical protein AXG93_4697s1370 [Marchantia polymorpha subsp. ruderalis]|uniref:Uncharacterized protein n=1 Tax=Marchantia polymorpha subsp. ruderalis TaxID=1480154 RepID=A0A176VNL8_MARPO|nr:hypothetical protein AXG93_4697s1370 [Marchantia polymorpha subsp. ruderalis]